MIEQAPQSAGRAVLAWAVLLSLVAAGAAWLTVSQLGNYSGAMAAPSLAAFALTPIAVVLFSRVGHGRWTIFGASLGLILAAIVFAVLCAIGQVYWSSKPWAFWMIPVNGPFVYARWTPQGLLIAGTWSVACVLTTCASGVLAGRLARLILGR